MLRTFSSRRQPKNYQASPLLSDLFTDTNNVLIENHSMNVGAGWSLNAGTFDIQSNRANVKTRAASTIALASADALNANVMVDCVLNRAAGQGGIAFRLTDVDNCWIITTDGTALYLVKREGGSPSVIDQTPMASSGDVAVKVWASGSKILASIAGVGLYTETATFNQTATRVGLYSERVGTRFDNFQVTTVPSFIESFTLAPSQLSDNGYSDDMTDYFLCSPLSKWSFSTTAEALSFVGYSNAYSDAVVGKIGVMVNGVRTYSTVFTANGAQTFVVPTLGAVGTKTVTLVESAQAKPSTTRLGSFIKSANFVGGITSLVAPTIPASRIAVYGDSISVGDHATYPFAEAWTVILRQYIDLIVEGWGNRSLYDDGVDAAARQVLVNRIASYTPSIVWLAIGTNDYGLNLWTAADFGTAYADLLDKLHTALPSATIYAQTPLARTVETANGLGSTLGDYRTQIATSQSTRSVWCVLVDGTALMVGNPASGDGVHPTTAQHSEIAASDKTILGL